MRKAVKLGRITPVGPKPNAPQQQNQQGRPQQGQPYQNQQCPAHPQGQQNRPQQQNYHGQNTQPQQSVRTLASLADSNVARKPQGRIVDTRTSNVEPDRYNEEYDRMALEKVKTDNVMKKQGLTQRSLQYCGRSRNARRETESECLRRTAQGRKQKQMTITIPEELIVGESALCPKATVVEVIRELMTLGVFTTVNDTTDFGTAALVALEPHAKVEKEVVVMIEEWIIDDGEDEDDNLVARAPVVVVMGHVDHGKTSPLDAIRNAKAMASEAGGITRHIGAYRVSVQDRSITFLDTPGHAAFTTMYACDAQVTDIVVLVVAAGDGAMPQTVEAINHAKAAGVSITVAVSRIDKPGASSGHVKQQLTEYGLVVEEWGGETPYIPVSAKTQQGTDDLFEMILLVADIKEPRANPGRTAEGTMIEARLDKGRGPIATVLVQNGTLYMGDIVVAGTSVGRVHAMMGDRGNCVQDAGPSMPVEIIGLGEAPVGGDTLNAVSNERSVRELVEQHYNDQKEEQFRAQMEVTLGNLFDQMQQGDMKTLQIIIKADAQGSVEAVRQSLERLSNEEARVAVIHGGVGAISESDIMLANASNAITVGSNVRLDPIAEGNAKRDGADTYLYRVIYDYIDEIEFAMKGMLVPKFREVALGKAEVRETYKISSVGTIIGARVIGDKLIRNAQVCVMRDGIVITEDKIAPLRRFKDDVKEVADGYDYDIGLDRFNDAKEGDALEVFAVEEYRED